MKLPKKKNAVLSAVLISATMLTTGSAFASTDEQGSKAPINLFSKIQAYKPSYEDDGRIQYADELITQIKAATPEQLKGFEPMNITAETWMQYKQLQDPKYLKNLVYVVDKNGNYLYSNGKKWIGKISVSLDDYLPVFEQDVASRLRAEKTVRTDRVSLFSVQVNNLNEVLYLINERFSIKENPNLRGDTGLEGYANTIGLIEQLSNFESDSLDEFYIVQENGVNSERAFILNNEGRLVKMLKGKVLVPKPASIKKAFPTSKTVISQKSLKDETSAEDLREILTENGIEF